MQLLHYNGIKPFYNYKVIKSHKKSYLSSRICMTSEQFMMDAVSNEPWGSHSVRPIAQRAIIVGYNVRNNRQCCDEAQRSHRVRHSRITSKSLYINTKVSRKMCKYNTKLGRKMCNCNTKLGRKMCKNYTKLGRKMCKHNTKLTRDTSTRTGTIDAMAG